MSTQINEFGGIKRGEVRAVRELKSGVQAQVALGYVPDHGVASVTVTCTSQRALAALSDLKRIIAEDTMHIVENVETS